MVSKCDANKEPKEYMEKALSSTIYRKKKLNLSIIYSIRSKAKLTSERAGKLMTKHLTKSPPSVYNIKDKMYIKVLGKDERMKRGGGRISAATALDGTAIGVDLEHFRYRVETIYDNGKLVIKWYKVSDITDKGYSGEK